MSVLRNLRWEPRSRKQLRCLQLILQLEHPLKEGPAGRPDRIYIVQPDSWQQLRGPWVSLSTGIVSNLQPRLADIL